MHKNDNAGLCLYAATLLEEMGFIKVETSPESLSMYFIHHYWPDRAVRVSNHGLQSRKRKSQAKRLGVKYLQNITYGENIKPKSKMAVDTVISNAIGFMIMEGCSSYKRAGPAGASK